MSITIRSCRSNTACGRSRRCSSSRAVASSASSSARCRARSSKPRSKSTLTKLIAIAVVVAACQRDPGAGGGSADHRKADCAQVVARIQQAVQSQIDQVGSAAKVLIDKMMPAMNIACVEDAWPVVLVQCVVASKPGDRKALEKCNAL